MIRVQKKNLNSARTTDRIYGILAAQILSSSPPSLGNVGSIQGTVALSTGTFPISAAWGTSTSYAVKYQMSQVSVSEQQLSLDRWLREIEEFTSLPCDWNGLESDAPNEVAVTLAKNTLLALASLDLSPDRVTPSAEGGIGICFRKENRFASVECLNSGHIIALLSDGSGNPMAWEVSPKPKAVMKAAQRIREHIASRASR